MNNKILNHCLASDNNITCQWPVVKRFKQQKIHYARKAHRNAKASCMHLAESTPSVTFKSTPRITFKMDR